jgi:hypothetical protein
MVYIYEDNKKLIIIQMCFKEVAGKYKVRIKT